MRVIAGKAKGRQLQSVPGPGTRPVTARAKTAFFDILQQSIVNAHFLDLFAGTGQVGIEALSRGAARVVFVEKMGIALRTIRANLRRTGLEEHAEIVAGDVFAYLRRAPEPFHYIYIAPPQYRGMWKRTLFLIDRRPGWLTADGWAVAQIHPTEFEELELEHLALFDRRTYGSVMYAFYCLRSADDEEQDV
ncbi:MAG: 16S rRNA (guanine(966)-N(2))-methyltransferase RsmD [Anaerolineae bacterium]